jgi:hypothetical protein
MYNSDAPSPADLPTSKQLLRSTLGALVAAIAILVVVVLPAEYAIDPTGIGKALGLTEMGEIKAQLAEEAAADAAAEVAAGAAAEAAAQAAAGDAGGSPAPAVVEAVAVPGEAASSSAEWRDELRLTLEPGQGAEVKLQMKAGERAEFSWTVAGGAVNFDLHGHGGGRSISYQKGRNAPSGEGTLEAAFDGRHGWFWRNRGAAAVTVALRVRGQYADLRRVL